MYLNEPVRSPRSTTYGNTEIGELIPDTKVVPPDVLFAQKRTEQEVRDLLQGLTPREQEVISRRYGLGNYFPQTLQQIGNAEGFNMSRERVRQIEGDALRKLKKLAKNRGLDPSIFN